MQMRSYAPTRPMPSEGSDRKQRQRSPALVQALTSDAYGNLRVTVAKVLGIIGPHAKAALTTLIGVLTNDADVVERSSAAFAQLTQSVLRLHTWRRHSSKSRGSYGHHWC